MNKIKIYPNSTSTMLLLNFEFFKKDAIIQIEQVQKKAVYKIK